MAQKITLSTNRAIKTKILLAKMSRTRTAPVAFLLAALAAISATALEKRGLLDSALKTAMQPLGAVENAVSPDAMNSFCKQNGYTLWVGNGPEPEEAKGIVDSAWSGWGKLTGAAVGAWAPEGVLMGKCEPLGWAKPGSDYAKEHYRGPPGGYLYPSGGSPGTATTIVTPGQPGRYTPGTPGTTTTYVQPGQPGSYQPGTPGTTTTYVTPGQPGSYQPGTPPQSTTYVQPGQPGSYQPGTPGTSTTYVTPGTPGHYTPGTPGQTVTYQQPPQQMCQCPCQG